MNLNSLYLIKRYPTLLYRFGNNSRLHHHLLSNKNFHVSHHYIPILLKKHSEILFRQISHFVNQEETKKEGQSYIEVPPLQFEDEQFDQPIEHEDLISSLGKSDTLAEQMQCLVQVLSLSSEDVDRRWRFCKTIECLFKPFFNDFKIQIFGSTVNSFGFKGCDIDMTFETTATEKDISCYLERPDVPLVCEVLSGKVSREELSELPLKEKLLFMHSVFLEYYKESEVPAKFINAYVPLVRFYHDKYNLKCDLTMKNKVAYANTKLLYMFANLDERAVPLLMTLRYWAKHVELIGKGLMFNTYTISLLVVYFLQTRSPPILPSAESILSLSDKFHIEDMNDKSFLDLLTKIPPTKNRQTLDELFKEFFFFYLYFDFTRVVCPLTASAVPRDEFFSKEENNRFRMNTMCVQDPLRTVHNVAELVDYKHCRKFFTEIIRICKMFQSQEAGKVNLINIFEKEEDNALWKMSNQKTISLNIPLCTSGNEPDIKGAESSAQKLLHVMKDVLLFECSDLQPKEIIQLLEKHDDLIARHKKEREDRISIKKAFQEEAMPHLKNRRWKKLPDEYKDKHMEELYSESLLEEFQKLNTTHKLILCTQCRVSRNTWLGRDLVSLENLSADSFLKQEELVSQIVAKQNASEQNVKPFVFLFECYTGLESSEQLFVNFRPLQKASFNPILGIFLKEYIPNIMRKILS